MSSNEMKMKACDPGLAPAPPEGSRWSRTPRGAGEPRPGPAPLGQVIPHGFIPISKEKLSYLPGCLKVK